MQRVFFGEVLSWHPARNLWPPSPAAPDGTGTVTISSEPDGAEIFVDEKFLGNAPASLKLSAGSHAILLRFPGHGDWRRTLEVLKSSKVSLRATVEPNP